MERVAIICNSKSAPANFLPFEPWAGFVLALLTGRCYFIDFPFYHRSFSPGLDLNWQAHAARLAALGHDVTAQPPLQLQFWKGQDLTAWLMRDQRVQYDDYYGIHLKNDPDYTAALLQANPFHAPLLRQLFPSGEMFQPLARFLLRVSCHACVRIFGRASVHRATCRARVQKSQLQLYVRGVLSLPVKFGALCMALFLNKPASCVSNTILRV
jgi:hypothetical protein